MWFSLAPAEVSHVNFSQVFHGVNQSTVILQWHHPTITKDPRSVVDNYSIIFSPAPLSHPSRIFVPYPPLNNVTLLHNRPYLMKITAMNCVGESENSTLQIFFRKYIIHNRIMFCFA